MSKRVTDASLEDGLRRAIEILVGQCPSETASVDSMLATLEALKPARRRLPELRQGFTRKVHIPRPEKASRADERALVVRWLGKQGAEGVKFAEQIATRAHGGPKPEPLKMWVTINTFPDGRPGEIFIKADKSGSLASGALDAVAIALSMAWQHGVPFEDTMKKFVGMRFEPNGITGDEAYPIVASALDYIARWALDKFGKKEG